jgi:hypothetical protein
MLRYNVSTPWDSMEGDWEAGPHYAGASAGLVHQVEPVAHVLSRIEADVEATLKRALNGQSSCVRVCLLLDGPFFIKWP